MVQTAQAGNRWHKAVYGFGRVAAMHERFDFSMTMRYNTLDFDIEVGLKAMGRLLGMVQGFHTEAVHVAETCRGRSARTHAGCMA